MATASEAAQVAKTPAWRARVEFYRLKGAVAIMAEPATTPNHAERVAYAAKILAGEPINEYAVAVATNPTVQTTIRMSTGSPDWGVPDNDVEFTVNSLLDGFAGVLHTDGYAGYDAAIGEYGLTSAGCWAHARRRFDEVFKAAGINPKKGLPKNKAPPAAVRKAAFALQRMKTLFAIEHRLRDDSAEQRQLARRRDSAPVLEQLRQWLDDTRPNETSWTVFKRIIDEKRAAGTMPEQGGH